MAAQDKFMLRLPDGMREAVAKRADENGRSMNSEIVQILQDALDVSVSPIDSSMSPEDAAATFQSEVEEFKRLLSKKEEDIMKVAKVFAQWAAQKEK